MSRFRLTREAKADARAIRSYIAKDRPAAADRLLDDLYERFRLAATQPGMGEARSELGPDLRIFSVGNYVVVFRPMRGGIEVVRIVHGARDLASLF
jgi:toxin ParE1/3/4